MKLDGARSQKAEENTVDAFATEKWNYPKDILKMISNEFSSGYMNNRLNKRYGRTANYMLKVLERISGLPLLPFVWNA